MSSYLLEYRYSGYPRKYFRDLHFELRRNYAITHHSYKFIPHITIAGPIESDNELELIEVLEEIIFKKAQYFHKIGNLISTGKYIKFNTLRDGKVIAIEVKPSKPLLALKKNIESTLNSIQGVKCCTYQEEIWHTTLWHMKNNAYANDAKFQTVWSNLNRNPRKMKFILDRITLIKNGKILREFDLVNLKTLNRLESLDSNLRYNSYVSIKSELESKGELFKS
jgi:2'-5' RNA ligase